MMDEEKRLKAREYLLRYRIYRVLAILCALVGLVVFMILYLQNFDGNVLAMLSSPLMILILLIPFLPAALLSWMAIRAENKFLDIMKEVGALAVEKDKN